MLDHTKPVQHLFVWTLSCVFDASGRPLVSPKRLVGCEGGGVGLLRAGGDSLTWKSLWVSWLLVLLFLGFKVSWFLSIDRSFMVSKLIGFKVSNIQWSHITKCSFHVFWKISILYSRCSKLASNNFKQFRFPNFETYNKSYFANLVSAFLELFEVSWSQQIKIIVFWGSGAGPQVPKS